ncbi:hypothetical protein HK097_009365, partial [Rhizophlyctis rosea]
MPTPDSLDLTDTTTYPSPPASPRPSLSLPHFHIPKFGKAKARDGKDKGPAAPEAAAVPRDGMEENRPGGQEQRESGGGSSGENQRVVRQSYDAGPYGRAVELDDDEAGASSTLKRRFHNFESELFARDDEYKARLRDAEQKYKTLERTTNSQLSSLQSSLSEHKHHLHLASSEIQTLQAQKASLSHDVLAREEKISTLEGVISELEEKVGEMEAEVGRRQQEVEEAKRNLEMEILSREEVVRNVRMAVEEEKGRVVEG